MNTILIKNIKISNFRSIVSLDLKIDNNNNFISLCGANNVGKTNILNALALFFDQFEYVAEKDCPNHKYYGTQGGNYQPKIIITFKQGNDEYIIIKDWNLTKKEKKEKSFKLVGKKNKIEIDDRDLQNFIKKVHFFYLEAINLSFPETIKYIMNSDIIDLETKGTRLSGKKKEMKEQIETILKDLQALLDVLGNNITPLLEKYKEGWGLAFDLPKEVNTFRDLMIAEVDFYIKDKSNSKAIDAKGSGLQRLCHILMYFRIIEKLNSKKESVILAIDEPDVYLHTGLQKKLYDDLCIRAKDNQIIVTTHSPVFIDTVKLSNVFLLNQEVIEDVEYKRAKRKSGDDKKFNVVSTKLVDFNESNGITKLKEYLGIEDKDSLLFDKYNILVEGIEDKEYLSKLMTHFGIQIPNIISCGGADNIVKYLEFYSSMAEKENKHKFLILLDDDIKGREVYKRIKDARYHNITIEKRYIQTSFGFEPQKDSNGNCNANIEIEDFIKPKIICYLANIMLKEKSLKPFSPKDISYIVSHIQKAAFQNGGILALLENKKNELNPDNGHILSIAGSGVKGGMASLFNKLDKEIITLIGDISDSDNIYIVKFLKEISGEETRTLF